jgi:hypothetical protein
MIRPPSPRADGLPAGDRSMRIAEYALATVAIVAAAIVALIR